MFRPHGRRLLPFLSASMLAWASSFSGCSAVAALAETHRAERALVSTHGLRSTPAATYALTVSRAYLEKSREEAAEAHYGRAVAYARAAAEAARDAQRTQVERITSEMVPAPRVRASSHGEGNR